MQLNLEENRQLLKIIGMVIKEACWDYSPTSNYTVLNINGAVCTMNKHEIKVLKRIKTMLEGGM